MEKYLGYKMGVKYKVYYKSPVCRKYKDEDIYVYKGNLENIRTGNIHTFINDDGEILHVHYDDIIQMRILK